MSNNPDVYLLYEYMKKNAFTVRIKANLTEKVDEDILTQAAGEAITRFPYYSVRVGLDEGENYVLLPNDRPIAVLPETDRRLVLGSEEVVQLGPFPVRRLRRDVLGQDDSVPVSD